MPKSTHYKWRQAINNNTFNHYYQNYQNIRDILTHTVMPKVANDLGEWVLIRYRETAKNHRHIDYLIAPDGIPTATLTRTPNGLLKHSGHKNHQMQKDLTNLPSTLIDSLKHSLQNKLIQETKNLVGKRCQQLLPYQTAMINELSIKITDGIISTNCRTAHLPSGTKTISPTRIQSASTRLIKQKLLNENTIELARFTYAYGSSKQFPSISHINATIRNLPALTELRKTAPKMAQWYAYLNDTNQIIQNPARHPGQIIRSIQDKLQLSNAAWKIFTLTLPENYPAVRNRDDTYRQRTIDNLKLTTETIAATNRTQAPQNAIRATVGHFSYNVHQGHIWAHQPGPDQNARRKLWLNILGAWLDHQTELAHGSSDEYQTKYGEQRDLNQVIDAVSDQWEQGYQWPHGNWNTHLQRNQRWHEHIIAMNREKQAKEIKEARWDTLIPETNIANLTLKPITSATDLCQTANIMNNCLASMWKPALQGRFRFFGIYESNQIMGVGQIINHNNNWSIGQVEGRNHRRPKPEWTAAITKIAKQYQNAMNATEV